MARLWAVITREYMERVRSKWFLVSTILAPLLFGVMLILPMWMARTMQPSADIGHIVILDATGSRLGTRIAGELNGGVTGDSSLTQVIEVASAALGRAESTSTQQVIAKRAKGYLVVDSATFSSLRARYSGTNATSEVDMRRLERILHDQVTAIRLERAGLDAVQVRALTSSAVTLQTDQLSERGRGGSGKVSMIFAFGVAFLLYIAIFLYGQNVLRGVIEEKQTRVAETVVSSISPTTLLAGKVLGVGAVGITQLTLSIAGSVLLVRLREPIMHRLGMPMVPMSLPHISPAVALLLLLYFLLGYVFYAALFAAVGALISTEQEAQQVQLPVAMLLVITALFIQPVMMAPEAPLARRLSWLPFSSPIIMPLRLSLGAISALDIALSLVSLVIGCAAVVWIAARIYRTGLLMYGKRATLGEIMRWVRVTR